MRLSVDFNWGNINNCRQPYDLQQGEKPILKKVSTCRMWNNSIEKISGLVHNNTINEINMTDMKPRQQLHYILLTWDSHFTTVTKTIFILFICPDSQNFGEIQKYFFGKG